MDIRIGAAAPVYGELSGMYMQGTHSAGPVLQLQVTSPVGVFNGEN
jgi:hypothetical protein